MKIILVTGGHGLIGNAIKKVCKEYHSHDDHKFIFVGSKDFNLISMEQTIQMFQTYKPHIVIHLAACVGGLYKNMNNKIDMLEQNVMMNYNVVKCSHDFKAEKLVACLYKCIFHYNSRRILA